ncbi:MAG: aminopeptidase [Streptosporangiales bacterium]|nr:aminopeptidase [Streptosporangiales bacterium]
MRHRMRALAAVVAAAGLACGAAAPAYAGPAPAAARAQADILDRLRALPDVISVEERSAPEGYRYFVVAFRQRVDHRDPSAGTFTQRYTVLHRDDDRPTVLHTSGYNVSLSGSRSEPTRLVDGNQISTEQRFFTPSRPDPADWTDLDIWQAATDHHRILAGLKTVYSGKWISTGASKGGMTSIYHRRFYPRDVDGTVAYVAPNDVIDSEDRADIRFFDTVGTDRACRADLKALQVEALKRRGEIVDRYEAWAAENGRTFENTIGSADRAYEMLVLDTPWAFWQYQTQAKCADVPKPDASTDMFWAFLDEVSGFDFYTDEGTEPYIPYYYQAGTQLGAPSVPTRHLRGRLRYRDLYQPRSYVPRDIPMRFDHRAMPDVDHWVRTRGSELLFVYGANDPWGAEPFRLGRGTRDSLWYTVTGGNHGANIAQLPEAQRANATTALRRWAGVPSVARLSEPKLIPGFDETLKRHPL